MDKTTTLVALRFVASHSPDLWLDRQDVASLCPSCAQKMASLGMRKIKASVLLEGTKEAAWESLPKGWTQESVKSFWDSLVGDVRHKVTKCIEQIEDKGGIDDAGAFCASLARKLK